MSEVIDTTQMYLRTVYELLEESVAPLRARIAERMGHSTPTVRKRCRGWRGMVCWRSIRTGESR